jgi:hypothetical protein
VNRTVEEFRLNVRKALASRISNLEPEIGTPPRLFQNGTPKPAPHLPTRLFAHLFAEKLRHEVQSFLCLR